MMWTTFLAFEIKVFTVSGAIAHWYFAPVSELHSGTAGRGRPSATFAALRTALGPQLGTLCMGSAVLTLISMLRQVGSWLAWVGG